MGTWSKKKRLITLNLMNSSSQRKFRGHGNSRHRTTGVSHRKVSRGSQADYVTRVAIFRFIWFNDPLEQGHYDYLFQHFPFLYDIKLCVQSFRQIYFCGSMPFLYLFIEKQLISEIPSFKSFAKGLAKDIEAVENSVASSRSNGFVEGINNKFKMIKRTMYGRGIAFFTAFNKFWWRWNWSAICMTSGNSSIKTRA